MTPTSPALPHAGSPVLRGEVLDRITEALIAAGGPADRAALVCDVVVELFAPVEWFQRNSIASEAELASLRTVLAAAERHVAQMQSMAGPGQDFGATSILTASSG